MSSNSRNLGRHALRLGPDLVESQIVPFPEIHERRKGNGVAPVPAIEPYPPTSLKGLAERHASMHVYDFRDTVMETVSPPWFGVAWTSPRTFRIQAAMPRMGRGQSNVAAKNAQFYIPLGAAEQPALAHPLGRSSHAPLPEADSLVTGRAREVPSERCSQVVAVERSKI